ALRASAHERSPAGGGGDILAAFHRITDRRSAVAAAGWKGPQLRAGAGVEREEVALGVAAEYQVASGGEHGGEKIVRVVIGPLFLSGRGFGGRDIGMWLRARRWPEAPEAADEGLAELRFLLTGDQVVTDLERRRVNPAGAGRVGNLVPALAADGA